MFFGSFGYSISNFDDTMLNIELVIKVYVKTTYMLCYVI